MGKYGLKQLAKIRVMGILVDTFSPLIMEKELFSILDNKLDNKNDNIINHSNTNEESKYSKKITKKSAYLVTLNPEIILQAHNDEEYFYVLNQADFSTVDGMGLKMAALLLGKNISRVAGSDLTKSLLIRAEDINLKVAIVNWEKSLSTEQDISRALKKYYPKLNFQVFSSPRSVIASPALLKELNEFAPQLLFITLGFPWQEKFIYFNREKIPSLKLSLGVGGSFDFLTHKAIRAPRILRLIGLEWFWRLLRQPKRIKRMWRAVVVFSWRIFFWKFVRPFLLRPNVACWLYRKNETSYQVLLVEREDDLGHWQLPQGGTDGESLKDAGSRELQEELNTTKFIVQKTIKNAFSYIWNHDAWIEEKNIIKRIIDMNDYKGQKQGLLIAKFTGQDSDIAVNFWDHSSFRWVNIDEAMAIIHPLRQESFKKYLEYFQEFIKETKD